MKNRDRFDISNLILQIANRYNNVTTTKIMSRGYSSYNQMKEHLMFLTERDLLYYDKNNGTFKTTEKGLRFLQIYNKIDDMIKEEEQQPSPQQQQMWKG
jgi:predicted transcriptional regulator